MDKNTKSEKQIVHQLLVQLIRCERQYESNIDHQSVDDAAQRLLLDIIAHAKSKPVNKYQMYQHISLN